MLVGAVFAFQAILAFGRNLTAPPPAGEPFASGPAPAHSAAFLHVLLALVVVIAVARLLGALFKYIHQPPVIGEVVAGILLGPSLFGRIAPEAAAFVLPPTVAPSLGVISQIGVILYMFLVGVELDTDLVRRRAHASVAVSHASIIVPFVLGGLLALAIYPTTSTSDVPFTVFALFMGVAMSVTAFPVLARILSDRQMSRTRLGSIALACAAVDDVTAWCLLAFVVGVVRSRVGGAVVTVALATGYVAFMLLFARPLLAKILRRFSARPASRPHVMSVIFVGLLLSALATEAIGIHAIFGAFLLGVCLPRDLDLVERVKTRLEEVVTILLLPAFFAFTGMRTQIGLVDGTTAWLICGAIIVVASVGKFGGTLVAARIGGFTWRDAASLGILMNTRGLMELIVLNVGLELRVLSPTLFAMLVIMAVVTTMATTPILGLLTRGTDLAPSSLPKTT
ncbi:MAG: cation:proton antiporter [Polyangiaceae bacterium]|nr:cation:proton antiporter [Polyangiaceae bacterium]